MKEEEIRRLVKIVEESNIGELEISRWGRTIKITKSSPNSHPYANSGTHLPATFSPAPPPQDASESGGAQKSAPVESKAEAKNTIEIKAPMVGTFYRSPSPEASAYVEVDQTIKKGQVLCIIEAMKLMNEIESDHDGKIVEILVESSQPVEYNQPLFVLEPI